MANLTEQQLSEFKQMLDERDRALRDELHREVNAKDEYLEVATEIPDPGDASFANLAVDLGNAQVTRDLAELRAVQAALTHLQNGTYGDCVNCGTEIPYERLKVQPTADRCAPCQEIYEKTHMTASRGGSI